MPPLFDKERKIDPALALELVRGRNWYQDFEIIPGVRTHGNYNPAGIWERLELPADLHHYSVADVGASNGYYSFAARQRGARVVAFDFRHKDNSGFGLAQFINGLSDIEHHHVNVLDLDVSEYGQFDIVLGLGLLYHLADPYRGLANLAQLCRDRLLLESYCVDNLVAPATAAEPVMRFIADPQRFPEKGQPNDDRSNFWGFTSVCLRQLVEEFGFTVKRAIVRADRVLIDAQRTAPPDVATPRLDVAYGVMQARPVGSNPNNWNDWQMF